jgi:hypothetical protein
MARIKNDPSGAISGMVGPAVFYTVKGKQYVRAAIKEREKDSWSPGQVTYRQKVSKAAAFWGTLASNPARESWKLAADGMSGYNLFLKTNLPAFKGDGSQMDLSWLHLSAGKLPLPHQLKAEAAEGDPTKWNISWQDDSGNALAQSDDELMVIFAHDGKFTKPVATGIKRNQQKALVQVPAGTGTVQGMYLFFVSADRKLYSGDQFVGI